jgi:hypothetical protein
VQRIIAGSLDPTVTPLPTATEVPACASAIWWHQARDHVGESRIIQGPVVRTRPGAGGSVWLDIGRAYPDPNGVAVLVQASTGAALAGHTVCVDGRIATLTGPTTIDARGAAGIRIVN